MTNPGLLRQLRRVAAPADRAVTDRQLLERFTGRRDEAAFAVLVERHGPMVLGVCRRVLRHAHDAEDAFQAAFLVLARKAGSIARPEALGNWLYGVAYRTALDARARAARRRAREVELAEEPAVTAEPAALAADVRDVLDAELQRLPDKFRAPVVLCYLEGRTNEEAARLLGCPKGTVLSRLATARERLRGRLTRRGVAVSAVIVSAGTLTAPVSAAAAASTARAATSFVWGPIVASFEATVLAKGVLKAMVIDSLKAATLLASLVVAFGLGLAWLGQALRAAGPDAAAGPPAARADGPTETLLALEKRSWEATKKKDTAALRKLCTDDYVAILSDGTRLTLDEFCALFPLFEVKSYKLSDVKLIPLGPDAAVLVYRAKVETVILGETEKEETQHSSTWVRRNGEWRNVFYQETTIDE